MFKAIFQVLLIGSIVAILALLVVQDATPAASHEQNILHTNNHECPPTPTPTEAPPTTPSAHLNAEKPPNPCSFLPFIQYHFGTPTPVLCPTVTPEASPTPGIHPTVPSFRTEKEKVFSVCVTATPFPTVEVPTPAP